MKICTIVGARPQFIKAAALSRKLREEHDEVLIHTGQHYSDNMSDVFFRDLHIPQPQYHLGICQGSHGQMTGRMLEAIETVLIQESPDLAIVYGDTNSTLAGALAAVKLHMPVCHIEAGVRTELLQSPEEVNRILTDRIATLLCCCTPAAIDNLAQEGITKGVHFTGDLMYDALLHYTAYLQAPGDDALISLDGNGIGIPKAYYFLTCHREENSRDDILLEILSAANALDAPVVYTVHPRNHDRILRLRQSSAFHNVLFAQPVGYLQSLYLIQHAKKVITDSGGVQREAFFLQIPCVTILSAAVWPETLQGNANQLCAPERHELLHKLAQDADFTAIKQYFGDGKAAEKILQILKEYERNTACNS